MSKYTPEIAAVVILGILYWLSPWWLPIALILAFVIAGQILERRYKGSVTYKVPQGSHYCLLRQRVLFWVWWIGCWKFHARVMDYTVTFDKSCEYDIAKDQSDWNKLPGFQSGFDKLNRTLRGWRYSEEVVPFGEFQVCGYFHRDSAKPEWGAEHVHTDGEHMDIWNTLFPWVTPLFVYFGGNQTAPHDVYVTISGIEVK